MCGTLSRSPDGSVHRRVAEADHAAGEQAEAARRALLARLEQHLQAEADAEERPRRRRLAATTSRSPLASRQRMQSGIALWPGSTTRSAARIACRVGGDDDASRSGATCASAFATERRLPIP